MTDERNMSGAASQAGTLGGKVREFSHLVDWIIKSDTPHVSSHLINRYINKQDNR